MSPVVRAGVVAYLIFLSLGLMAGSWKLQGPIVIDGPAGHGAHLGDLVVVALTIVVAILVLRARD